MKMKAAVVSPNAPYFVEVVEKQIRPLQFNEALVEVEYCGVCHTDLHVACGDYGQKAGRVLGHEGIGVVSQVADGVTALKIGDRVSIAWMYKSCGACEYCTTGRETLCRNVLNAGYTVDGGMATHCIVNADYAVKVPKNLNPAQASSITCAGVTTYKGIKVSGIQPGQWLAVFGVGGLGNLGVQYAKKVFGAHVVAIDINDEKLEFAKQVGADFALNANTCDVAKVLQDKIGGAHAAIVTAVSKVAFNCAVDSVRAGAKVVALGLPPENMDLSIPRIVLDGIEVVGSLVGTRKDLQEAFQFGAEGLVVPKVTLCALTDAPQIFKKMQDGSITGRMVIDMKKPCTVSHA